VRAVFADTLYWGAILHPMDQYRAQVVRVPEALGDIRLVTTDEVLTELLDGLAERGPHLRNAAARAILTDRRVTVHPQSRASFLAGLRLFQQRNEKGYSLVDCISMTTMRRHPGILANSHPFIQECSKPILRRSPRSRTLVRIPTDPLRTARILGLTRTEPRTATQVRSDKNEIMCACVSLASSYSRERWSLP